MVIAGIAAIIPIIFLGTVPNIYTKFFKINKVSTQRCILIHTPLLSMPYQYELNLTIIGKNMVITLYLTFVKYGDITNEKGAFSFHYGDKNRSSKR